MTGTITSQAQALKQEFDSGFASLPERKEEHTADLLSITLLGTQYALHLSSVLGLYANKKITRVPAAKPGLLGIAGFRGIILPVYDLAALIGLPAGAHPKWLAVAKSGDVAIAFEAFGGHLRVPESALATNDYKDGVRRFVSQLVQSEDGLRGVIDLETALKPVTA